MFHEENWRVSLCVQELYHPQDFSEFLQPLRDFTTQQVALFFLVILIFIWFWRFGWFSQQLFWNFRRVRISPFFPFNMFTWHRYRIQIFPCWHSHGWWGRRAWRIFFKWSVSCLEGVMDVERRELDEELVDKPGTTIGTKFSVLHCVRIPF